MRYSVVCAVVSAVVAGGCASKPEPAGPGLAASGIAGRSQESRLGPLFFDPKSADYTGWINSFKNQVYRNWVVPEAALRGARGHVNIEFTVERSGAMSALKLLRSSGSSALDEAATQALRRSQLTNLPEDYKEERVTMQLSFFYNEAPR